MSESPSGRILEEFKVTGGQLVEKIKELINEGNVRHIRVKQDGRTLLELPLTVVAVGVLVSPVLAALGAFAALATECTVEVEREAKPQDSDKD